MHRTCLYLVGGPLLTIALSLTAWARPATIRIEATDKVYVIERSLGAGGFGSVVAAKSADAPELAFKIIEIPEQGGGPRRVFEQAMTFYQSLHQRFAMRPPRYLLVYSAPEMAVVTDERGRRRRVAVISSEVAAGSLLDEINRLGGEVDGLSRETMQQRFELARKLIKASIGALAELKREGIVLGDVKPANILIMGDRMVFADFDGAVDEGERNLIRTPDYSAPDATTGHGWFGPYADVYSVGATLYTVLVGRPPLTDYIEHQYPGIDDDRLKFQRDYFRTLLAHSQSEYEAFQAFLATRLAQAARLAGEDERTASIVAFTLATMKRTPVLRIAALWATEDGAQLLGAMGETAPPPEARGLVVSFCSLLSGRWLVERRSAKTKIN